MKTKPRDKSKVNRGRISPAVLNYLVAKLNALKVRRETLDGREYLVVPTTILRPDSVLNGSKGPLYYPRDEVAKNPGAWDGIPLLLNHPTNGTSGRTPRVIASQGIGYCFNDRVTNSGARVVDAWFDVEKTKRHDRDLPADKRILPKLEGGAAIDVSTGLFTDERRVANRLKDSRNPHKTADVVTSNYRPDHLAVLPLVKGACSAADGCGTGVANSNPNPDDKPEPTSNGDDPMPMTKNQRKRVVAGLTTNCECWAGKDAALNAMDDETLKSVARQAKELLANREAVAAVSEVLGIEEDSGVVFNAEFVKSPDMKKKMKAACGEPDADDTPKKNAKKVEPEDEEDAVDVAEQIKSAVADAVKSHPTVKNAARVMARERAKLVARLTAVANHERTPAARRTMITNKLKLKGDEALDVEQLEELLVLTGDAPTANESDDDFDVPVRKGKRKPTSNDADSRYYDPDSPDYTDEDYSGMLLPDYSGAGGGGSQGSRADNADRVDNDDLTAKFGDGDDFEPRTDWSVAGVANRIKDHENGKAK